MPRFEHLTQAGKDRYILKCPQCGGTHLSIKDYCGDEDRTTIGLFCNSCKNNTDMNLYSENGKIFVTYMKWEKS